MQERPQNRNLGRGTVKPRGASLTNGLILVVVVVLFLTCFVEGVESRKAGRHGNGSCSGGKRRVNGSCRYIKTRLINRARPPPPQSRPTPPPPPSHSTHLDEKLIDLERVKTQSSAKRAMPGSTLSNVLIYATIFVSIIVLIYDAKRAKLETIPYRNAEMLASLRTQN
jgi:hypothetical protein